MFKNYITSFFQKYLFNKNINHFKGKLTYYLLFRLVRNFLNAEIIIKIYNFCVYASNKKTKNSYALIHKCGFDDISELELIKFICFKKKIFLVDCGCNFGFYSLFTASLSKKNIVKSFDASQTLINDLKKNIKLNNLNNIEAKKVAISNIANKKKIFYISKNDWESSITHRNFNEQNSLIVNSSTIDYELKNSKLNDFIVIVKLDIEGHEFNALEGSLNLIKKYDPLFILEVSKYNMSNKEFNLTYLENFLKKNDYCIYNISCEKITIKHLEKILFELNKSMNTIGNYYIVKKASEAEKYINLKKYE